MLVAAMTRTSTLIGWVPPTRKKVRSSSTRSSFTCVAGVISPTSSRKIVPPSASSKRPSRRSAAPVNAPFSWPNSSLSSSVSGSAAQFTATNGLPRRGDPVGRVGRLLEERREPEPAGEALGIGLGRLHEPERGDRAVARQPEELRRRRLVQPSRQHQTVGNGLAPQDGLAGLVDGRGERGLEPRGLELGVDPDRVFQVAGGDYYANSPQPSALSLRPCRRAPA